MSLNKKILLIEDNPDDVELTLRAFKNNNIMNEIIIKHDGVEALDFLFGEIGTSVRKEEHPFPSLILLDLKLPKLDGLEVLKKLKSDERTKMIPVVILTSSKEQSDMINCYRQGCNSYIRKPVDSAEFTYMTKQLGTYWLLLNEVPNQLA